MKNSALYNLLVFHLEAFLLVNTLTENAVYINICQYGISDCYLLLNDS